LKRFVISVLIADRVGVLRDIASAIFNSGGNIDGISQTVVANYFTVILTATFKSDSISSQTLQESILSKFNTDEASVVVRDYKPCASPLHNVQTEKYVITIQGHDRPGILKKITEIISSKNINIEDWYVEFRENFVTHIGEVTVPAKLNISQLRMEINSALQPIGFACHIQHANIFRVTNEVGPVKTMLMDKKYED